MMDDNKRIRKAAVIAVGILAVFIYILAYLPKSGLKVQTISTPDTLASTAALGTDSFVYSNGQTLEKRNYLTGQTQAIAPPNAGLNAIDTVSVSPNGNYILFHDRTFNTNGALGQLISRQNLDPGVDYWWVYNVKSQTFQYLPQGVILAQVGNNYVYILSSSGTSEQITTYHIANLQQVSAIGVVGSSNFYPVSGGFLLQTPDNELLFTRNGTVSNELFPSIALTGVSTDGQTAIGVVLQNGSHNLVSIDLRNDSVSNIASGIINAPAWLNSGAVLYVNSQNHLIFYDLQTHKSSYWSLTGALSKTNPSDLKLVSVVGPSAAIVANQSGTDYLIGPKLASTPIR